MSTTKALKLLNDNKTVKERANAYFSSIKRDIFDEEIKPIEKKIEKIDSDLFDLEDFTLDTNLNKGNQRMTKEDCQKRFKDIMDKTYEKKLLELELEVKKDVYSQYFGEEVYDEQE